MSIKTAGEGDSVTTETMTDRLRAVQSEIWRKLEYVRDAEDAAWDVYNESLLLASKDGAAYEEGGTPKDLEESVPRLETTWTQQQLFENITGTKSYFEPKKNGNPKGKEVDKAPVSIKSKSQNDAEHASTEAEPKKPKPRGRPSAASKRGGRGGKGAPGSKNSGSTMMDLTGD
jgi:DNA-directed RNA polymerase III subunit RPC5